jgi:hypothetical protein
MEGLGTCVSLQVRVYDYRTTPTPVTTMETLVWLPLRRSQVTQGKLLHVGCYLSRHSLQSPRLSAASTLQFTGRNMPAAVGGRCQDHSLPTMLISRVHWIASLVL